MEWFGCNETTCTKQCQIVLIVTQCSEMCAILVDLIAVTERFSCIEITKQCQIVPIVTQCSEMCATYFSGFAY